MITYGAYLGTEREMKIKKPKPAIPQIMQIDGKYMMLSSKGSGGVLFKACKELEYARTIVLLLY
ncbi:MAG: hypothetical protein HY831_04115 [Candidatus Aenigmarchaeota archaeon]|nr:hypothetical protein [Candidatus Aenigmarchaeota archaeon]